MIQADKFKNVLEVLDFFKEESTCKTYLEQQRWNGKVCCPHCQHEKVYRTNRGFKCASPTCYKKFTVLVGTPFENTKIKLRFWFAAIYLISAHKKGISSHQLSRDLGISQSAAWFLNHRIRQMFINHAPEKLTSVVQCDETYIGGKNKNKHKNKQNKHTQGRSSDKTPVFGILQPNGEVRTFVVPNTGPKVLQPIIDANVEEGALVMTDEWAGYANVKQNYNHAIVCHSAKQFVDGMVSTNGVENFWSHFKRGITGIYIQVSPKHLDRYCLEYAYRFNTRKITSEERFGNVIANANGNRLTYKNLIAK